MSELQQMSEPQKPLMLFVPSELEPAEHADWVQAIIAELRDHDLVTTESEETWRTLLAETISVGPHPLAIAYFLMIMPEAQPVYVWATVGEPPSGRAKELLISLGNEVAQGFNNQTSHITVDDVTVDVGLFVGRQKESDGSAVNYLMGAVASTLTFPEMGDIDVCLWYTSTELEEMPEALPFLANFIRDPDVVNFLAS